jgi:hypothetical protein
MKLASPGTKPAKIFPRYGSYLYLLVLLPCLLYTIFYTARAVQLDYIVVPFWDPWRCVQYVEQLLRFDVGHFWVQHNEHRIVFPEIVFALDYILLRGRQILPIACNMACQVIQFVLLCWLLKTLQEIPAAFRLAFGACCGLFMVSAIQVQGLLTPFLLQWYLSQTAAALAFLFLWLSARSGQLVGVILSVAAAVVATYSTANGMLLWPILVMMAVVLRLPERRIASIAIAGLLSIAAYFVGYSFIGEGRAGIFLRHPFYALWFVCVYLGAPVSYVSTLSGGLIGLIGLLLVILALTIAIWRRRPADPVFVVTVGVCLFIACSALLVAYGRMDPTDAGVNAAKAERYASVPLTWWAYLVGVICWLITILPTPARQLAAHVGAAGLVLVILVAVMAGKNLSSAHFRRNRR